MLSNMLDKQFEVLLKQYQTTYQDFMNDLKTPSYQNSLLFGTGLDGTLFQKSLLKDKDVGFQPIANNHLFSSVSTNIANQSLTLCGKTDQSIYIQDTVDSIPQKMDNSCCVVKAILLSDSSLIGISDDHKLYVKKNKSDNSWTGPVNDSEFLFIDIASCPDDSLLAVSIDNHLYRFSNYQQLNTKPSTFSLDTKINAVTVSKTGQVFIVLTDKPVIQMTESYLLINNSGWIDISDNPNNLTSLAIYSNPISLEKLESLQKINIQLMDSVKKMQEKEGFVIIKTNNLLDNIYQKLQMDQSQLEKLGQEFQTLNQQQMDSSLFVDYYQWIFFIFFMLVLVFIYYLMKTGFSLVTHND